MGYGERLLTDVRENIQRGNSSTVILEEEGDQE